MEGLVSVIIPTYSRPQMLREALQSVKNQDYAKLEIIVVDDNSWEDTSIVAKEFPDVVFLKNDKNMGPGYSRKKGLEYCKGEFVVFLDDDDYYTDNSFFSKCVELFPQKEEAAFVVATAMIVETNTKKKRSYNLLQSGWVPAIDYLRDFNIKKPSPQSTFTSMFSKKHLLNCGIMDMEMVNDMAIYMRALTSGYVFCMNNCIGVYRVHNANISKQITGDFVIKNMKEKLAVYQYIVANSLFDQYDDWWFKQMDITVSYYVYGSAPSLLDFRKVRKWCISNSVDQVKVREQLNKYQEYIVSIKKSKIKNRIKNLFGW